MAKDSRNALRSELPDADTIVEGQGLICNRERGTVVGLSTARRMATIAGAQYVTVSTDSGSLIASSQRVGDYSLGDRAICVSRRDTVESPWIYELERC